MAKNSIKNYEDRVRLRLTKNEDKEFQKYLEECFKKYIEPKVKFMEPDVKGEDTITAACGEFEVGDIIASDESLYYNNIKNARRAYLEIFETEEGNLECQAVMVVKSMITDEDLKKAGKNKAFVYIMIMVLMLITGIVGFVRGKIGDGILFVVLVPVIYYIAFVKRKGKNEDFLPRSKRKQK